MCNRGSEDVNWIRIIGKGKPHVAENYGARCDEDDRGGRVYYEWSGNEGSVRWTTTIGWNTDHEAHGEGVVRFDGSNEGLAKAISEAKRNVTRALSANAKGG